MQRLGSVQATLTSSQSTLLSTIGKNAPDDVVIVAAYRTPLCKAGKGGLKDTAPEILLSTVLKGLIERTKVDPKLIEDMVVGNCLQPGAGALIARAAQLLADFPVESTCAAINRQCSSGIEACSIVAAKIKAGIIDAGIGAGVESMSLFDMNGMVDPNAISDKLFDHETARNCLLGMGQTSENVAEKYKLQRSTLDKFAAESNRRAAHAQKEVKTILKDKDGNAKDVVISKDDGIRAETTFEGLSKLKPSFKKDGVSTAGNSSQTTDGAAAVLLTRRSFAEKNGWPIIGRFIAYAVAGVPPEIMGVGPAYAIPKVLAKAGITKDQVDIYELNEAFARIECETDLSMNCLANFVFATQATWSADQLGLDYKKVNPAGGAIAIGHPLGCTGARQVATLLNGLKRTNGKLGVISMCIGTGMGAAALIERV